MCPSHWLVGFTRVHRDLVVSDGKSGVYPDTVRRTLTRTVSSSRELPRLSRVLRLRTAPHASERDHLPWGCSGPSSRHQLAAICGGLPYHHQSVLDVSHAHDGFQLRRPCGFVSPHSHVQGSSLQGLCLPQSRNRLVVDPCPRGVGSVPLPSSVPNTRAFGPSRRRRFPARRPQGVAPCGNP